MGKVLLSFDIRVIHNQYKENETEINYDIKEFIDDELTLKDAIDYIYKEYSINISLEEQKHRYTNLTKYIFSVINLYSANYNENDVINTSIKTLEEYFKISKNTLLLHYVEGIGEAIGECDGIKFIIHSNERDRHQYTPHIHCKYQGEETRIRIDDVSIMDKGFKSNKKTKQALDYVEKNKDELIRIWDLFVIKGLPFEFEGVI